MKKQKINIVSLGCSKNLVDSENLITQIKDNYEITHNSNKKSDIVVINTCGFIKDAKEESIDTILQFAQLKQSGNIKELFVMGCLSERYKTDLQKEIPEADAWFGVNDLQSILKKLKVQHKTQLIGERQITTPKHFAYIKISEGCDRTCSFCAIPLIRGKHISIPETEIIDQVKFLADQGTKEFILIAQDLTYYGMDIAKKSTFISLIDKISQIQGVDWLRLHYVYPHNFPLELLDLINERPNICKYLDMPLQHISNNVLRAMRRAHTQAGTLAILDQIKSKIPDIALRTTLMTGHPGETKKEFEELKQFVSDYKFDRLGVFTYSEEEDTWGKQNLNDMVPQKVKQDRADEIMAIQQQISFDLNQAKTGKTFKTLIDRKEGEYYIGRTEFDSPEVDNEVLIKSENPIKTGEFYNVKITKSVEFDLYGIVE